MKRIILKTVISSLAVASLVAIGHADIQSCIHQATYNDPLRRSSPCDEGLINLQNSQYVDLYVTQCMPKLYNCIQAEINANTQNAINNANAQIGTLNNQRTTDITNINNRFNGDEAAINNNHNNVLAQIQATNNSIAATVTNTVNQQLPTQVSQNLPQVVQSQLTPDLIAKGLQSQYQTALNTKFKTNSGALYIRGFMTKVNENGGQELQVYAVDDKDNFCNSQDGFKTPAQATLYMGQKNATTIAAYLFSAYATGKPVVLETQGIVGTDGILQCHIINIKQDIDVNTLKA
ncbi:hypothetical protein [Cysteiniphilum sp. QT6929]|uniref:hypothetical protein n=1 Tax=Cysteiniphilum sp. QT6929 TaxID=2975055 RepID=UPI0024B347D6|nr:hypothetical protein [Cysteiniphilum sp. QT6929]WHN66096.1 hypothetical protein NYP54_02375 [Cysteiniphilum sp. QT6929]